MRWCKNRNVHSFSLILIFLLFMCGCSVLFTIPKVNVDNISTSKVDTAGIDLVINLKLNNENSFDITLLGYSYNFKVNEKTISFGGDRQTIIFKSKQITTIPIPIRIKYSDLIEIVKLYPKTNLIPYHLVGGLQVDTPLGEKSIPIETRDIFLILEKYQYSIILQRFKNIFK